MHDFLETVWESSVDGIIAVSSDGKIVAANPSAQQMFGYGPELVGRNVEQLLPLHLRDAHRQHRAAFEEVGRARRMTSNHLVAMTASGAEIPVDITLTPVVGRDVTIAIVRDVTATHELQVRLRYLGFHDALTGVYNRAFYEEELERAEVSRARPVSVIIADVNKLKRINDTHGHAAGDRVLCDVANMLKQAVRAEDVVARIGGDEFAVLLRGVNDAALADIVQRIQALSATLEHGYGLAVGGAVGLAGDYLVDIVRLADARMYTVKRQQGRD